MKEITLEKLYLSLKYEAPEILLSDELIKAAYKPIKRMLDISAKYNL
jgi:quinolinate synthase